MDANIQYLFCEWAAPSKARSWLADARTRQGVPSWAQDAAVTADAQLCLSELVTNAYQAGCAMAIIGMHLTSQLLRLFVEDDAPVLPTIRAPDPRREHGRGLQLIEAISSARGTAPIPNGKPVWVELRRPPRPV